MKKNEEINHKEINEVVFLGKKILKLLYIVMIVTIILSATIILKNLKIFDLLFSLLKVISPLFFGFVIAWLLNPLVAKMKNKGIPRIAGSLIVYAVFLIFLYIFLRILLPTLYSQINDLIAILPSILDKGKIFLEDFVDQMAISGVDLVSFKDNIINGVGTWVVTFTNSIPNIIIGSLGKLISGIGTVLISLVVGLYMLFDFDAIKKHFMKLVPSKNKYEIEILISDIGKEVRRTVSGTLLVALMVLVCDTIGFSIIGLNAPLLFGVFCGLTDLIPYIGPYIGGAAAVLVGFSQSTFIGVAVLIVCVIVQLLENYVLQPIVMSKASHLHPVTIIIGLLVFAHFFGIFGMIIATPLIALFKVIFRFIINKYNLFKDDEVLLEIFQD